MQRIEAHMTTSGKLRMVQEDGSDGRMHLHCTNDGHDWRAIVMPNEGIAEDGAVSIVQDTESRLELESGVFYSSGTHAAGAPGGVSAMLSPTWPCVRTKRIIVTAEGTEFVTQIERHATDPDKDIERVIAGDLTGGGKVIVAIIGDTGTPVTLTGNDTYVQIERDSGSWKVVLGPDPVTNDAAVVALLTYARAQGTGAMV
jgi:hypothetical protein